MSVSKYLLSFASSMVLIGCAAPPTANFPPPSDFVAIQNIVIPDKYPMGNLTPETLATLASSCVTTLQPTARSIQDLRARMPIPSNQHVALGHASSAHLFLATRESGICIQRSEARYPIFAAEALLATVNPNGVPPDITTQWYSQIAKQIAIHGTAKVVYRFTNGNANLATYWVSGPSLRDHTLFYSIEFKRRGEWENQAFDLQFADTRLSGVSSTEINGRREKHNPIAHRGR